jgi:flagellar motor switch/type III secretory pathway protein FliN
MTVLPYLLLGSTQRKALHDALTARLTQWRERWSTSSTTISVHIPETAAHGWAQLPAGNAWFSAVADDVPLVEAHLSPNFLSTLLGAESTAQEFGAVAHDVASQLRSEVLRSLCSILLNGMGMQLLDFDEEPGTQAGRLAVARAERALPVTVTFGSGKSAWTIILHPRVVEFLLPRRKSSTERVERRRSAIGAERLRVEALLGEVEVSLAELASLTHGDVLVLDKALAEPAQLITELGINVTSVVLGAAEGRRAVRPSK